jgi:ferredoxin-nitrite reductase
VTGCPVAGLAHDELFDVTPVVDEVTSFFYGNPDYSDLPRKHKITISRARTAAMRRRSTAFPRRRAPGRRAGLRRARRRRPLVGARLARDLGVFVRSRRGGACPRALLDAWKEDLRYRVSRVKARLKFMVDDIGPEGMRAEVERRLGYALPDFSLDGRRP